MSQPLTSTRVLRITARTLLVVITLVWFVFAVLSGAGQFGEGIGALVQNLPNALPWLALSGLVAVAFYWELIGGALLTLAGFGSIVFFHAWTAPIVLFSVALPLIAAGLALIVCWYRDRPST